MKNNVVHTKDRYYQNMQVKKLENIIQNLDYYGFTDESSKLIKILDKKINKIYSPEMNRKENVKSFSKYRKRG
ncbi:MAG: hypothetical protein IJO32_05705 [Bacilli bacterium]|nr:hypothetical protein [Bacilli bacterium]